MLLGSLKEIDLAEDSRESVLVLILHIRAVAPLENQHLEIVVSCLEEFRYVYLARAVADLTVSCKFVVHEKIEAGIHALEVYVYFLFQKILSDIKLS